MSTCRTCPTCPARAGCRSSEPCDTYTPLALKGPGHVGTSAHQRRSDRRARERTRKLLTVSLRRALEQARQGQVKRGGPRRWPRSRLQRPALASSALEGPKAPTRRGDVATGRLLAATSPLPSVTSVTARARARHVPGALASLADLTQASSEARGKLEGRAHVQSPRGAFSAFRRFRRFRRPTPSAERKALGGNERAPTAGVSPVANSTTSPACGQFRTGIDAEPEMTRVLNRSFRLGRHRSPGSGSSRPTRRHASPPRSSKALEQCRRTRPTAPPRGHFFATSPRRASSPRPRPRDGPSRRRRLHGALSARTQPSKGPRPWDGNKIRLRRIATRSDSHTKPRKRSP